MIIFGFMLMNLFAAIVLESYEMRRYIEDAKVSSSSLVNFVNRWRIYDYNGDGMVEHYKVNRMFQGMEPPLGLNEKYRNEHMCSLLLKSLKVPLYKDVRSGYLFYNFHDIALALTSKRLKGSKKYDDIYDKIVKCHEYLE